MRFKTYKEFSQKINVSCETYEKFIIYFDLLCKWQEKMNLVSKKSLNDAFCRHFLDSAQLYKFCSNTKGNILDFGSGAGFPGLVLAIMGLKKVHLVDSNNKKCIFLKETLKSTDTKACVHNCRIENLPFMNPSFIMSRALAPTKKLLNLCINYMNKENKALNFVNTNKFLPNLLFLKGKNYKRELMEVSENIRTRFEIYDSLSDEEGKVLFYKSEKNFL